MLTIDRSFRPDPATIPPKGEVEVARICYPDTAGSDVVSVLAKRKGKRIVYRVVTDNGDVMATRTPAALPLTMGQLIHLIHRAKQAGSYWHYLLHYCGMQRRDLPAYQVFSDHYPDLFAYYSAQYRGRRHPARRHKRRGQQIDAARLAAIRRGLLANLRWEERAKDIRRDDTEREAAVQRFLSLRFAV